METIQFKETTISWLKDAQQLKTITDSLEEQIERNRNEIKQSELKLKVEISKQASDFFKDSEEGKMFLKMKASTDPFYTFGQLIPIIVWEVCMYGRKELIIPQDYKGGEGIISDRLWNQFTAFFYGFGIGTNVLGVITEEPMGKKLLFTLNEK